MALSDYSRYGSAAEKLATAIRNDKVSHAYIIEGDSNIDKLAFAKEFAKALVCSEEPGEGCDRCPNCRKIDNDNYEDMYDVKIDGKSVKNRQIDELRANLKNKPTGGDRNIAIIEDGDTMTPQGQARLLKTLEEPNPGTVIMILSENVQNLLPTINSRCIVIRLVDFEGNDDSDMIEFAAEILDAVKTRGYFFDIKKKLDGKVKERSDAFAFLDGMENVLGRYLRSGDGGFSDDQLTKGVRCVEEARRAMQRKAIQKYVIRDLILKLEEL